MSKEKIPFLDVPFGKRQAQEGCLWDIRDSSSAKVCFSVVNMICWGSFIILLLTGMDAEQKSSWDRSTWFIIVYCFFVLFISTSNRGVVIDAYARRIWFWKRFGFFRIVDALSTAQYSLLRVSVAPHQSRDHGKGFSVSLSACSYTMKAIVTRHEEDAIAYSSQMQLFLNEYRVLGGIEYGTFDYNNIRMLFSACIGFLFLVIYLLYSE